jgi:predicted DNA-binding protein (MmcQ/YjbR family)
MDEEELASACGGMPGAVEEMPFGDGARVFKVGGKMFALIAVAAEPGLISLKCDPEYALELRAQYESVEGAYHFNKRHWNQVRCDGEVPPDEVLEMIDHSYELVRTSLPKKVQATLT